MTQNPIIKQVSAEGKVTLPAPIRKELNIEPGDYVEVVVKGDSIIITPVKIAKRN